jgi:hypothetical protein
MDLLINSNKKKHGRNCTTNLPEAFEKFVRHANLVLIGPLADKPEKEKGVIPTFVAW